MLQIGDLRGAQALFHIAGMTIRNALQPGLAKVSPSLGQPQCIMDHAAMWSLPMCDVHVTHSCARIPCKPSGASRKLSGSRCSRSPDMCCSKVWLTPEACRVSTGTANTALVFHAQKLLALHEADCPFHVSPTPSMHLLTHSLFTSQCWHLRATYSQLPAASKHESADTAGSVYCHDTVFSHPQA